jgi:hypothetical protein
LDNKTNKIAICQINSRHHQNIGKCNYCDDRFICHSNKYDIDDVRVNNNVFMVPNNDEGNEFIRLVRKYVNREKFDKVIIYGRAKHRKERGGNSLYINPKKAEKIAVYFHTSPIVKRKENAIVDKLAEWKANTRK